MNWMRGPEDSGSLQSNVRSVADGLGMKFSQPIRPGKFIALENDVRSTCAYLEMGLLALNSLDGGNDRWHPSFLLLAFGVEKLGKLVIALYELNYSAELPTDQEFRKHYRHDLEAISTAVLRIVGRSSDGAPFWKIESDFVSGDTTLRTLLELWSAFGNQGRYESLSAFLDDNDSESIDEGFRRLERQFFDSDPIWEAAIGEPGFDNFYPALNAHLTETVQRYVRLHALLFVRGTLGEVGRRVSSHLGLWAALRTDELSVPQSRLNWIGS